jgi:hypothetical protein
MQQPWCSRGAGAVFSRRSLKLARLHLVFSNSWRWRSAAINAANSSTVIATRCSLMRLRTQIRYMVGSTYRPLAICLSQRSLTWDEWSSPDELIHPGDLASVASITSSEGELDFAIAVMAI